MDPITAAIVAAAVAGVASGATKVGESAIVDAYNALKSAIKKKFGSDSKVSEAVEKVEEEPEFEPNQSALAGRIEQTKADQDPKLIELAEALISALNSTQEGQAALGKYQIDARGAQVGVIGDKTKVEGGIHFGAKPES